MASIMKGVVSMFVVTACSGVYSSKPHLPGTSIDSAWKPRMGSSDVEGRNRSSVQYSIQSAGSVSLTTTNDGGGSAISRHVLHEESSIQPVDTPFIQEPEGGLRKRRQGITLLALGEPKSGTTWTGRMVPELAIQLCGSFNNRWCQLGGVAVSPRNPSPSYEFELLKKTTNGNSNPELFLHFYGRAKHIIPGMDQQLPNACLNGGRQHKNGFMDLQPCEGVEVPTRQRLTSCLWKTSEQCVSKMSSVGPSVTRSIVIMRDPRNVVISEYKMRTHGNDQRVANLSLEEFVKWKFEIIVSWMHQRYTWHTGPLMEASSHIEFYEDLQESHLGFIGIAGFMGLECSEEQASEVWNAHKQQSPDRGYGTHGLSVETITSMNTTMARLLPPALALRWEVPLVRR